MATRALGRRTLTGRPGTSRATSVRLSESLCRHTLHLVDQNGARCGSWIGENTPEGIRYSCRNCGKFYGYAPAGTFAAAPSMTQVDHQPHVNP